MSMTNAGAAGFHAPTAGRQPQNDSATVALDVQSGWNRAYRAEQERIRAKAERRR